MKRAFGTGRPALIVIILAVVISPLPEGSASPWALTVLEIAIFGLFAVLLGQLALGRGDTTDLRRGCAFAMPLLSFAGLIIFQITPLPPAVLKTVSPGTYRLYQVALPGWPDQLVQHRLGDDQVSTASIVRKPLQTLLPTSEKPLAVLSATAEFPVANRSARRIDNLITPKRSWRTISTAPSMTRRALLEIAAYEALFFVILLCPFGGSKAEAENSVYRALLMACLLSGLIVALVAIIEWFDWNGKILWLFVPYDWGAPQTAPLTRAIGPFVNPDHLGDYLALVLPLAIGGVAFGSDLFSNSRAIRAFCAVAAFLILSGLLLSMSRGAWIGSAIGAVVLFGVIAQMPDRAHWRFWRLRKETILIAAVCASGILLALAFMFIGPNGREQIDIRLQQTVYNEDGFRERLELGADTLAMVRDFPLLGVGLGCWPELFPRYRRPPWTALMYREAHNDYVQLLAETGVVGFGMILWFLYLALSRIFKALAGALSASSLFVSLCPAFAVIAFHEFFDFSLRTPANAVLLIVLLGLALRMADREYANLTVRSHNASLRFAAAFGSLIALVLITCAFRQEKRPYPYNIESAHSAVQAMRLILAHPAESGLHLELARLLGQQISSQRSVCDIRAAVWLNPTNPYNSDIYAQSLLQQGDTSRALESITRSIANSPSLATHRYLQKGMISRLSPLERKAVEDGFDTAIARGYSGAVQGLAEFFLTLGRFGDAGRLYGEAAQKERDPKIQEEYLLSAGTASVRGADLARAQGFFESAIRCAPADIRPYENLITMVLGPHHQLQQAESVVAEGIRAGVSGADLYAALADAAQAAGDTSMTKAALEGAVNSQPTYAGLMRLGTFYLTQKNYGWAAMYLRRATAADPDSAEACYRLGIAEELDYRFSDAERDLSCAIRLSPNDTAYRDHYANFEQKVAQTLKQPLSARE